MPIKKSQNISARKIAANRRNAQKSTGPRHARQPRTSCQIRQQNWVRSLFDNQVKLGEDPDGFASFLSDLIDDWQPAGVTEMTLVEDLTVLEWERRKIDRAQDGWLVQRLTREEHKRAKHARQLDDASTAATSRDEVHASGLQSSPDCPAKFREMIKILDALLENVKNRDFSASVDDLFQQLYGKNPNWRATQISSIFAAFVNGLVEVPGAPGSGREDEPREPAQSADDGEAKKEDEEDEPEGEMTDAEHHYRELHSLLLEEYNNTAADYQDFMRDHIQISRPLRDSLLAFTGPKSAQVIRHRNSVDRHFERKMKLLMALQKERRSRQAQAPLDSFPGASRRRGEPAPGAPQQTSRRLTPAAAGAMGAIFFLLGMLSTHPRPASSIGFAFSAVAPGFRPADPSVAAALPQITGPADAALKGGAIPARRARSVSPAILPRSHAAMNIGFPGKIAPKPAYVRDVFLHIESHQVIENNEKVMEAKANFGPQCIGSSLDQVFEEIGPFRPVDGPRAKGPMKESDEESSRGSISFNRSIFPSNWLRCDSLQTVTFAT